MYPLIEVKNLADEKPKENERCCVSDGEDWVWCHWSGEYFVDDHGDIYEGVTWFSEPTTIKTEPRIGQRCLVYDTVNRHWIFAYWDGVNFIEWARDGDRQVEYSKWYPSPGSG